MSEKRNVSVTSSSFRKESASENYGADASNPRHEGERLERPCKSRKHESLNILKVL